MTNGKTEKTATEKIAFAVVLVISLVAAQAVVNLRSIMRLSAPVELNKSGLSVSMPQGGAWKTDGRWKFDGNGFTTSSVFISGGEGGRSYARCRYILADKDMTVQQRLSEYASSMNSELVETGQLQIKDLVVDWAKINDGNEESSSIAFEVIFGVSLLPDGRHLEIEVLATEDEKDLARSIFNAIINSIRFRDNGLLKAGIQIVDDCRNRGLAASMNSQEKQVSFFVLTDASNQPVGFTMDATTPAQNIESEIEEASYFYRKGRPSEEEVGLLKTDSSFTKFTWRIENRAGAKARRFEMSAEDQNLIIQQQSGEKEYTLSKATVPEIIADTILGAFVDSNQNAIVFDIIGADGTISPLYAEKTGQTEDSNQIINVELLNERASRQKIYYDNSKNQTKIIFENDGVLTPSTAGEIAKLFPERANLILDRNRFFDSKGI